MTTRFLHCFLGLSFIGGIVQAQDTSIQISDSEIEKMYTTETMNRTSVHDPSVVYDETSKQYYIFGSHIAVARTRDLQNWTWVNVPWGSINADGETVSGTPSVDAFHTNQTKEITVNGQSIKFGNFDAAGWSCALGNGNDSDDSLTDWSVEGNMWAPDVIYNPVMKKWCQYLSLNGPSWNSCIILLTADHIEGPYIYQGPVVYTGFRNNTDERISFHKTDLELVIGAQTSLPDRYDKGNSWGSFWPHAIDPCVFYDEAGKLWIAYGSWSGGIFMLRLDEQTGLRDYDVTYDSDYDSLHERLTSDAYFGKKIAGGYYVSGEGPYIEHIGRYYYLFMSYGEYAPDGGYEMRIFRSENPDGPYKDINNIDARYSQYALNYGMNADNRGEKLMGYYNKWGFMNVGECSQGHNSAIVAPDGNTYLVYHTKFNDGTAGHQVRVHQLFVNSKDWLVAAPFEYQGEKISNEQISGEELFSKAEIAGIYQILIHPYGMNHRQFQESTPSSVTLLEDGSIQGAYTGKWSLAEGTSYLTLTLDNQKYEGVVIEQHMEPTTIKALCFTACSQSGVNIWGYKMEEPYAIAYAVNSLHLPFNNNQVVSKHLPLYETEVPEGVHMQWMSSEPEVISNTGMYNPQGLTEELPVELTLKLSCGQYYWTKTYQVTAKRETAPTGDYLTGLKAYYSFDQQPVTNAYNTSQKALFRSEGNNQVPSLLTDSSRIGNVLHQYFGASGNCSYTQMSNSLKDVTEEGATIAMWIKRTDNVPWDAVWSFYNPAANTRLYFTGNAYFGFNDGQNWLDINHPSSVTSDLIPVGKWTHVAVTVSKESGVTIYIDGVRMRSMTYAGVSHGSEITSQVGFDYALLVDFIRNCPQFYLGYGSFWGSVDVKVDDVMLYNRALPASDIRALNTMCNRLTDFTVGEGGTSIHQVETEPETDADDRIYDLSGKRTDRPQKGIYIMDGKKKVIR